MKQEQLHIGHKIAFRRKLLKLSQKELAEKTICSQGLISFIEQNGKVHHDTLLRICNALEISLETLDNTGKIEDEIITNIQFAGNSIDLITKLLKTLEEISNNQKEILKLIQNKI